MRRRTMDALVVCWALATTGCLIEPQDADCSGVTSCDGCAARSGCGWCNGSQSCVRGTSLGPAGGACPDWRFATCEGADPYRCRDETSCDVCGDALGHCGWCIAARRCQPAGDPCTGAVVTDTRACGGSICNPLADCAACVSNPQSCYWCTDRPGCQSSSTSCPNYHYVSRYSGMCR